MEGLTITEYWVLRVGTAGRSLPGNDVTECGRNENIVSEEKVSMICILEAVQ